MLLSFLRPTRTPRAGQHIYRTLILYALRQGIPGRNNVGQHVAPRFCGRVECDTLHGLAGFTYDVSYYWHVWPPVPVHCDVVHHLPTRPDAPVGGAYGSPFEGQDNGSIIMPLGGITPGRVTIPPGWIVPGPKLSAGMCLGTNHINYGPQFVY